MRCSQISRYLVKGQGSLNCSRLERNSARCFQPGPTHSSLAVKSHSNADNSCVAPITVTAAENLKLITLSMERNLNGADRFHSIIL